MRLFLHLTFLFFSSAVFAQKPIETVIAIKTPDSKFQFVNRHSRAPVNNLLWDEADAFVNGYARVYRDQRFSFVNGSGKLIAPVEFEDARDFSNKLAAVQKNGNWGFIDASGKTIIPFKYSIVFDFDQPTVTVGFDGKKWWLINSRGAVIKQLDITVCYGFKNGVAKVVKAGKEGILYPDGKIVFSQAKAALIKPVSWHPNLNNAVVPCPDNLGFEFGDFTKWECFAGDVDSIGNTNVITVALTGPLANRHTVYPRAVPSALDNYGLFEINPPDGSNFAVKLGNTQTGAEAERIRYTINVPLNDSNFSVKYDYAVVFQDPGHTPWTQPRFTSRLIDSATNTAIDCASLEYIATSGLPGFKISPVNASVIYKPWASVFYSLRGYGGRTLYLEFTTADCVRTGHWGYAYVDVQSTCGSPVEVHYECLAPHETTLTAPPGFEFYNWWDSGFTTLLGTGQQLYMNPGPPVNTIIWVELIPYNSFGCQDTLLVNLNGDFDAELDVSGANGCAPQTFTFYNRNIPSVTTLWDFGDGNTATGDTVTHTYAIPGTYHVTLNVTVPGGCSGTAIHLITIYPPPVMAKPTDQTLCNDARTTDVIFSGSPSGIVFNWTNSNPSIGLPANGSGDILSFIAINTGNTPVTATITVTPVHLTCTGTPEVFTITVNPSPNVVQPADQVLCNGSTTNVIAFTGTLSGTTFNWTNSNPSIGLAASGSGDIPAFTAINTGSTPVVATIIVVPSNGICPGIDRFFRITVNPTPNVVRPANQTICNNATTSAVNFTGAVSGTGFSWTNNNPSIGLATSGNGNIPSFTAVNTGNVPETATITVTPSANGCPGPAQIFTITVNPTPDVYQPTSQVLCNAAATNAVNFNGSVVGTSFTWTNDNTSIGLAANGTGNIPSFTAINVTNAPVTATIIITPSANGCTGTVRGFTITVNPTPNVVQPPNQVVCDGAATSVINFTGAVSGTSFSWTNDNVSIGLAASGTGNLPSFTAINTTTAPVIANLIVTPSANGCAGIARAFTIIVNPSPNVVQPVSQVVCNNSATSAVNFTGAVSGTIFNWTNNNTSIGLAASGIGDIPVFTAINPTAAPVIATITVTPLANGCFGPAQSFTITVNPSPDVAQPASQVLCNNTATNAINFTGAVAGTIFYWTNSDPSIGLAASGTGDIPSFTAINLSNAPVTAVLSVAPYANGCNGPSKNFTITVNPTPDVVQPNHQVRCHGVATSPTNFLSFVFGTTFNWTNNNTTIGLAASGSGDIPSFTAINTTTAVVIATITVTPTANGCPGPSKSFTIRVNPAPNVLQPANQVLCNGSTTNAINFTGAVSGTSFNWTNNNPSIGLAASGTGNILPFAAINLTNAPVTATISITPSANNCLGIVQSFTITVNPTPNVVQPANQVVCNAAATNAINFTGAVSGTGFSWTNDNTSIGLAASGTGDIPSFTAINASNVPVTATIIVTPSANACPGPAQSFTITVNPTPNVVQHADQTLCDGFTTNAIIFSGDVAGTSFNWINSASSIGLASSGTGNIAPFNATNTGSSPVNASIIVTPVARGCSGSTKTATLTVNPNPKVDLGPNLTLSTGTVTNLSATIQNGPISNWLWTPATGLNCTDCPSPELKVTNDITYHVTVTNVYGCIATDNISISTFCKNSQVFVPKAFTPNGDGLNDILMVRGKGIFVTSFRIFNRWGELVFQKTNFNPNDTQYGWDGKIKGKPASPDVFVFTADVICDNGIKYTYKGNLTLLK